MRGIRIGLGLWAGLLFWLMVLVAPSLFANVPDRALAGSLAGHLFRAATWLSLAFGLLLAATTAGTLSPRLRLVVLAPGALLVGSELVLRPALQAARLAGSGFALWHGIASGVYVLAAALVAGVWWRVEGMVRPAE